VQDLVNSLSTVLGAGRRRCCSCHLAGEMAELLPGWTAFAVGVTVVIIDTGTSRVTKAASVLGVLCSAAMH